MPDGNLYKNLFNSGSAVNPTFMKIIHHSTDGDLVYVSDINDNTVKRFYTDGTFKDIFVTCGDDTSPHGLEYYNGNLLVACRDANCVKRYNGITGAYIDDFVKKGSGGLIRPMGIHIGLDNGGKSNLLVCSAGTHQILRYKGTSWDLAEQGDFMDIYVSKSDMNMDGTTDGTPYSIHFHPTGPTNKMYVTDYTNNHVKRFENINSTTMTAKYEKVFTESAGNLTAPYDLSFDPTGEYLYVSHCSTRTYGDVSTHHVGNSEIKIFHGLSPSGTASEGDYVGNMTNDTTHIPFNPKGIIFTPTSLLMKNIELLSVGLVKKNLK